MHSINKLHRCPDGICNKHLIFASPQLCIHLCLLFNAIILNYVFVQYDFCVGIILSFHKSKHGDACLLNMYCGITLPLVRSTIDVLSDIYAFVRC